jgi:hypothetical protein
MSFKRALALTLTVAAALPAAASAQEQIAPPRGDNYLGPVFLNDESAPFPSDPIGIVADTTSYTTQADMFNPPSQGGPAEPNDCGTPYGNTIWSVFYSNRYGLMNVSSAGPFDSVIAVIPFNGPDDPAPDFDNGYCTDSLTGFQQDTSFLVSPKRWYAIQVGGTGNPQGGSLQVKYQLDPPPRIDADAVLSWRTNGRVATVKSLVVNAPKGARVAVSCTHHGCGKNPKPFTVKKGALLKPIAAVGPAAPAGVHMTREGTLGAGARTAAPAGDAAVKAQAKTQVRAAKKYKLLAGRKLKNGTQIVIRVYASGYIGKHFSYKVKSGGVSSKTVRCTNPGSSKPRKKCG